jgi:tellurite methyltransferase
MSYDQLYKNNIVWGHQPNELMTQVFGMISGNVQFLDLGCGQGRDILFMLANGFQVTGVDKSQEGLRQIQDVAKAKGMPTASLDLICEDIADFNIEENKFDIISAYNSLQFLPKDYALLVLESIKSNLKKNGYIIISAFTIDDPSYKTVGVHGRCYFGHGELKNIFSDLNIIMYEEKILNDSGHPGLPEPHIHGVVKIIAQKY